MTESEVRVSYGVKELLGQINAKLENIDAKLDKKADIADIAALTKRLDTNDQRISDIREDMRVRLAKESERAAGQAIALTKREKLMGALIAVAAVVVPQIHHWP